MTDVGLLNLRRAGMSKTLITSLATLRCLDAEKAILVQSFSERITRLVYSLEVARILSSVYLSRLISLIPSTVAQGFF